MAAHVPAHFARCVRRTAPVPYEQALAAASVSWAARAAAAAGAEIADVRTAGFA